MTGGRKETRLFEGKGMMIGNTRYLSPGEAYKLQGKKVVFIDLRPDFEIAAKRISVQTIVYIFRKELSEKYQVLNPINHFILIDEVGLYSKEAARFMMEKGFLNVACISGGIVDWEKDGLPVDIEKMELLTGSCMCTLKARKRFKKTDDKSRV